MDWVPGDLAGAAGGRFRRGWSLFFIDALIVHNMDIQSAPAMTAGELPC